MSKFDGRVVGAQPQAGGLFPGGAEPGRLGEPSASASRDMPSPFSTACSC